jgi:deoxyribodipyrimidine photolyase-related protein
MWYTASTKVPIVDATIREAFYYGYIHHIKRLMVMSNFMTLCEVHPDQIFAWMYEFSLDSWDWVMVFNVYSMGTWSDGGHAMRKPYISSAAYIQRMADVSKGPWVDTWNKKFHAFLEKHKRVLWHTQYAQHIIRNG